MKHRVCSCLQKQCKKIFQTTDECQSQKSKDLWIIRWIKLNDPVHCRDIQTPGCDVRAEKDGLFGVAEMKEHFRSLVLLLLPL